MLCVPPKVALKTGHRERQAGRCGQWSRMRQRGINPNCCRQIARLVS
jgi:hypothetical protein